MTHRNRSTFCIFIRIVRPFLAIASQPCSNSHPLFHVGLKDASNLMQLFLFGHCAFFRLCITILDSFRCHRYFKNGRCGKTTRKEKIVTTAFPLKKPKCLNALFGARITRCKKKWFCELNCFSADLLNI